MCTCRIQWIDSQGNPTPDANPAVGVAWTVDYYHMMRDGHVIHFTESEAFPICEAHRARMDAPETAFWRFAPYYGPIAPERPVATRGESREDFGHWGMRDTCDEEYT